MNFIVVLKSYGLWQTSEQYINREAVQDVRDFFDRNQGQNETMRFYLALMLLWYDFNVE